MSLKKVALTAIALLLAVTGFSQNNQNGTLVTAPIRPFAVQDTFPTAWANEVRGGPFTYSTLSELSNIPTSRLVVGSIGYVSSENKYYRLTAVSPVTWSDFDTVSRSSLGFSTILDPLWTASNPSSARTALGLSTNLETFWTATNADDARAALQITNTGGSGTNSGTVTSVALALPSLFSVTGSPVTNSGTFNVSLVNQPQRSFLASPNNSAGTPIFRTITAADIPTLNQNTTGTASNVSGVVAISNGGTGATNVESARGNLGFNSSLNSFWTASSASNARVAIDAAKLSMNVAGPFEAVNNFLNPANTILQNETLIRVGVAEQVNQSAQFGYRVVGTDSNGVVGRAVFSVYGFDALMQVGSGAQSGTNYETEVFAGGGTNNKVMTLIKNTTGHMEMDRPISFSTATHAANTRTNLGFNSSLNAFWTATNTDSAIAALGIGASGTSTVTRASLGFNASLDSLWTATDAEAARNALEISNIATNVTRSSLGFSTNLDSLWTATTSAGARTAIGFSAGMEPVWSATNTAIFRTNIGLGAPWLTNSTTAEFRAALQLGGEQVVYFSEVSVGRALDAYTIRGTAPQTQQNFGIAFSKTGANFLEFSNNSGSGVINIIGTNGGIVATNATTRANIRTNLDLGWPGLTNTSASNFRVALGLNSALNNFWTASNTSSALNSLFISNNLTTINSGKTRFNSSVTDNDVLELVHSTSGSLLDIVLGSENLIDGTYVANPKGSIGSGNGIFGVKYGTNNSDWGYPILLAPNSTDSIIAADGTTGSSEIKSRLGFSTNLNSFWNATTATAARDALGITTTGSTNTRETLGFSTNLDTFWTATNFADARAALGIDTNNLTTRESLGLATNSSVQFSNLFLSQPASAGLYTLSLGSANTGFRGIGSGTNDWVFNIDGIEYIGLYQSNVTLGNAGIPTRIMSPMTFLYGAISGGSTNNGYIAFGGTAPQTGAAISRTNLGLGWSALTNTNSSVRLLGTTVNNTVVHETGSLIFPEGIQLNGGDVIFEGGFLTWGGSAGLNLEEQSIWNSTMGNVLSYGGSVLNAYVPVRFNNLFQLTATNDYSLMFEGASWTVGFIAIDEPPWVGYQAPVGSYAGSVDGSFVKYGENETDWGKILFIDNGNKLIMPSLPSQNTDPLQIIGSIAFDDITLGSAITVSQTGIDNLKLSNGQISFDFVLTDEDPASGYSAPMGSYAGNPSGSFIKYGPSDTDWGSLLYLNKDGSSGIARTNLDLSAPWLTNTNQLSFADAANVVPIDTYTSSSFGGGAGPNPVYPITNNVTAQRRLRSTYTVYPGWLGTNTSGVNVYQTNDISLRLIMPRSLDGSKRGDIFILTSQFSGVGTNNTVTVSRYGHTYSTNYLTNLVDIDVFTNTTAGAGFINYDGYNWKRMTPADLGIPNAIEWVTPPAATNSTGTPGQAAYSDNYLYICISSNTWRRATLATW